jgi:AcrR family transcriptional regulator
MAADRGNLATMEPNAKTPRTERGRKTLRAILDAAAGEFGEKGFYESSIVGITSRAGVALGSFYTYFDSKDAIYRALVRDMSAQVGAQAAQGAREAKDPLERETAAFRAFLEFTRAHKEIYRIIDEAEFADPESHRQHYESTAARILGRLQEGAAQGVFRADIEEAHAWAVMGMNVFLGLRFGVWSDGEDSGHIAAIAHDFIAKGLGR